MDEYHRGIVIIELNNGKYAIQNTIHYIKIKEFKSLEDAVLFIEKVSHKLIKE